MLFQLTFALDGLGINLPFEPELWSEPKSWWATIFAAVMGVALAIGGAFLCLVCAPAGIALISHGVG